jgi:hypothetical protein
LFILLLAKFFRKLTIPNKEKKKNKIIDGRRDYDIRDGRSVRNKIKIT